jgi:Ca2+-binding RTX toxin-like protein
VIVNATNAANTIDVAGAGGAVTVTGLAAQVAVKNAEGALDDLVINGLGGNDTITATALAAGVIGLTIDGGAGRDRMFGSQGADVFLGGTGRDFVFGDNGDDTAFLGAGDDRFQWDPGDGSDTVEGQDGVDELLFNGAGASETVDIFANGGRTIFFRDVATVTMDLDDVERITFNALGGADSIAVADLTGTDVTEVHVNLGLDGVQDSVTRRGTNGADAINAATFRGQATVSGLPGLLRISGVDFGLDRLTIDGLGGDDTIDASALQAGRFQLAMNGGLGADTMIGSGGDDFFNGGDGDDLALMGAGDDTFVWNPGDDNDTLEGQAGADTMLFNGSNAAEQVDISANGGRAIFFRNVASVTMDLNDVETIEFNALGGADNVVVNDLTGTDVTTVAVNLGNADAAPDTLTAMATGADDVVLAFGSAGSATVLGLAAMIEVSGAEAANDRLVVNLLDGDDVFEGSGLQASAIQLVVDGGEGDDVIIGGEGDDILLGGAGDDVLIGGPGTDVLDGGLGGDDIVIQLTAGDVTVRGFDAGEGDTLDLSAFQGVSYRSLMSGARTGTGDAVLDLGDTTVTLLDVGASLQGENVLL